MTAPAEAATRQVQIGRFRITALRDAMFALDGGAMFGVVPRAIWQKLTPVNDDHTIPLSTTPYLVEDGEHRIVIEPGLGRRWSARERERFHIDHSGGNDLLESLHVAGVEPWQVTHCLMTHLHWDHIGAVVDENGDPVFPNARHWTPKTEWDACMSGDHLRKASYRPEDITPVKDAGMLETFDGLCEPVPGVRMIELGGHSDGVSIVVIQDGDEAACFWADVVPTRNHVHIPFIMAYDMNAEASYDVRSEWIPKAAAKDWVALLYHDPVSPIGRFAFDGKKYAFAAL